MKVQIFGLSLVLGLVVAVCGITAAEKESGEKEFAATCPVSGEAAAEDESIDHKGAKVYFCCPNCTKAYEKDPEKFTLQARRQLLETDQAVQVACPVSGQAVDEGTVVEVGETKVAFCCENCQAKYDDASDENKLKVLFATFKKGFTRQTKCPLSDKPINPAVSVEHDGEKVYFCCPGCPAGFKADPEKYVSKLPQFEKESN